MFGQLKADPLAMDRTGTSAVGYLLLNPDPRFNATQVMEVIAAVIRAASADGPDRLAKQPVTVSEVHISPLCLFAQGLCRVPAACSCL